MKFSEIKQLLGKRQLKLGITEFVFIIFVILILSIVNFMAFRHRYRWDVTETGQYSLSPQTKQLLANLKKDIKILAFVRQGEKQKIADLLKEYAYHSRRVSYEFIDPDRNPGKAQLYRIEQYGTLVFLTNTKKEKLENPEEEKDITNAILRVTKDEKKNIYFLSGHGEKDLDSPDESGYSKLKDILKDENYNVKKLTLLRKAGVPPSCALLIIAGPQKTPLDHEKKEIDKYMTTGGRAIFMLDPYPAYDGKELLKKWGVGPKDDIVIDKLSRLFGGDYFMPVITKYNPHQITENFNIASFFPIARSIYPLENFEDTDIKIQILAETGEGSWAETDRNKAEFNPDKDTQGPISMVVAVSRKSKQEENETKDDKYIPCLVVFGDSDFVTNRYLNLQGNKDLFLNCLNWLAEEKDLIAIGPKPKKSNIISLTVSQSHFIFYLCVIIVPLAILSTGVIIWYRLFK